VFREKFKGQNLDKVTNVTVGINSGGNERFVRFRWEVDSTNISYNYPIDKRRRNNVGNFVKRIEIVKKELIRGYNYDKPEEFIKITLKNPPLVSVLSYILDEGIEINTKNGSIIVKKRTFESNIITVTITRNS
jgi:hypothetical protein